MPDPGLARRVPADPDHFALLLASLLDGLAVQIALKNTDVTPGLNCELRTAEAA